MRGYVVYWTREREGVSCELGSCGAEAANAALTGPDEKEGIVRRKKKRGGAIRVGLCGHGLRGEIGVKWPAEPDGVIRGTRGEDADRRGEC
jgi:hypothetical protein